ncbi:hypothetical protein HPB50_023817 [Hyalomma asiaticum]|uniref:Uncharacterized protein n=1 Tax=Hyalomma asiaticum TaxID=266040 RepID=A0ACB7T960_HYAAI|nr:hypothetical protein HPB50_023817 [Hyalomma asiaticum]
MRAIQMNRGHRPFYAPARHWTRPYLPASECPPPNRHQRRIPAGGPRTIVTWTLWTPAGSPVSWASRLPWELQPRPAIGDPRAAAPEPTRNAPAAIPERGASPNSPRAPASHCRSRPQGSASPTAIEAVVALIRTLRPQLLREEPPRSGTPPPEETTDLLFLDMDI